ncbi:MAG: ABC transporter permease, partial [Betaproteobacteria bacterium]
LGKDPLRGLSMFFIEPMANLRLVGEVLLKATPLVLCALGLAVCYRSNVWNIGAEGQFLLGAICASGAALWMGDLGLPGVADSATPMAAGAAGPRGVYAPLVLLAGVLGGAAWAGLTAWLKDRYNANEILVSLMLVYVAQQLLNYLVFGPWKDPKGFNFPQTPSFDATMLLPPLLSGTRLHMGALLAVVAVVGFAVFLFRSWQGYQLQVGGLAPAAARYAGFSDRRALWVALGISGAMAGLAGAMEAAGPLQRLTPHVSTGYGFTAIIVAFIGRLHPVGILVGGFLVSMVLIGGELAQSRMGLPNALTGVFQGLLLFLLLACDTLVTHRLRWKPRTTAASNAGTTNTGGRP